MKTKGIYLLLAALIVLYSCGNHQEQTTSDNITLTPDAGTTVRSGEAVPVKVSAGDIKPDSVVYLLDSTRVGVQKDLSAFSLKTDSVKLGVRIITAKVYQGGKSNEGSTNVVIVAAKAPEVLTYKIEKSFPHDTSSFTEGLEYHDGYFYESDGGYAGSSEGNSSLRKVDPATGKAVLKTDVDPKVFAEGITVIDGKVIQLTYHEKVGYTYDAKTLKRLSTFPFNAAAQGWGLCNDGKQLYATFAESDAGGTNQILILDKNTYQRKGVIDVYDDKGPVTNLNELEYINGMLYANVWQTDTIVVIDPKTGAVQQRIDLGTLYPADQRAPNADVLNGIAYDKAGNRIFITGKKWPKLYQVKFVKPAA
ncbi:glutaminyl-peptide cyclotransferase [Mucilaginibacter sp. RS28]|uniref:Glutaminyl-peptide cyclotransferase n=1 Tax=Mucilaginibacter straminoryzae TaxID=2932774 RepID=A0A9X2B8B5_9SPHI|nr:glutaminyl-peptide cyclotransferase [Mucilaginibacter straminoryzae]MCJ8209296.1 glutaminyl-peptide cyclotransferase [Mucilaginibacter straminoryzae]